MGERKIAGQRIVLTGASSGIGRAAAIQLAAEGAEVLLMARRETELEEVCAEIRQSGGQGQGWPVDLSDFDALDEAAARILAEHGKVDVLVNNAARSIRRPVSQSLDRFHDYERTIRLNYLAAVRLTLKLLPPMMEAGDGHIINISTWGTLLPAPLFSAYTASKSALDGFSDSLGVEMQPKGIAVTRIHYPLVHTPMSAPTRHYEKLPALSVDKAASWIVRAVRERPPRLAPGWAVASNLNATLFPRLMRYLASKAPV